MMLFFIAMLAYTVCALGFLAKTYFDQLKELDEKLEDYLRAGVKLIWVINPETRTLQVYYPDGTSRRLHEADEVSGDNVIPGFRCSVATLFPAALEVPPATTVSPSA